MNSFQILAILACVAGLNAFRVGNPVIGKCPAVITTKPDFDYKQYAGNWFEIKRMPVIFEADMSCVQAIYGEIRPGVVSVSNTATLSNGGFTNITGEATAPFPDQPGYLMVKFPYRPPAGYRVLETDYTTFASVYECVQSGPYKFEYGWLLARTSTLTESQIQEAMDVYTKQGIDTKTFIKTIQNDDCHYV